VDKILMYIIVGGLFGTVYGGYKCIEGHTYSVAARHEATAVGRVVEISSGRGGEEEYNYVFSVNGVKMNDYSNVCATPLAPGACFNKGPVLVYYSYQPFSNSRLEDFAVSSASDYRFGKPALAIALPLFVLSCAGMVFLTRKDKGEDEDDPEPIDQSDLDSEVPDAIHIAPQE
jgi:hypothetical protein